MKITIGSRGSDLALWQAHHVEDQLKKTGAEVEIKIIKTQGDRIQHLSFDKMEGKGFFTKEIEAALHSGEIDLAVHSHKDLETTDPDGLVIAAVSEREDPADLLLIRKECLDQNRKFGMKEHAVLGTSSARRKAQALHFRPDLEIKDIRGNVPTRIQKLRDGNFDAIMLAYAGAARLELDLTEFEVIKMNPKEFVPAPAQGVLGLQVRNHDKEAINALKTLNRPDVEQRIKIERGILRRFNGGCQMPLGVYCTKSGDEFTVYAAKANEWNSPVSQLKISGINPGKLIEEAYERLK